MHDPGRGDQRLRPAAEVGVDAAGEADRPRVRRHAGGQRRRAVRPRRAAQQGEITPAQFVDLNQKVGGLDADANYTPRRMRGRPHGARQRLPQRHDQRDQQPQPRRRSSTAAGPTRGSSTTPTGRSRSAPGSTARTAATRNQLIWEGPVRSIGRHAVRAQQLPGDGPLARPRSRRTSSRAPLAQKVVRDKPKDLTDRCYDGNGHKLSDGLCPAGVVNVEGTPRTVAGDAITTDDEQVPAEAARPQRGLRAAAVHGRAVEQAEGDLPQGRLRLLQAGRRTAGDDPVADLPEPPRQRDLRRQAARVRAEEQALQAEAALVASASRRQAWWATRSMLARWRT